MSCGSDKGVKLLEHDIKIVERVLERQIRILINLNKMQFGFTEGKWQNLAVYSSYYAALLEE